MELKPCPFFGTHVQITKTPLGELFIVTGDHDENCLLRKMVWHPGFCLYESPEAAADVRPVPEGGIGEMSDGYHTFNGLYYQRMVLFAAIVKAHKDKAWKSWKHEDGEFCFGGGWFIVGIDTPEGSFTYHYDKMYWNLFECKELPTAKHWDGHTEKDVTRLLSLDVRPVVLCRDCKHNNACLTQAFVEEASRVPFNRNTFFCADGKRAEDA